MITVKIEGLDKVRSLLAKVKKTVEHEITPVVEMAAADAVQDHLATNYVGKPNKLGGVSTGYWAAVSNGMEATHDKESVNITLRGAGLRMKYEGGIIRPTGRISSATGKPIRFLAIPMDAQSHGKVPAMFGKALYVGAVKEDGTGAGLFLQVGPTKSQSDPLLFWLARSATIKADKNILPPPATVQRVAGEAIAIKMAAL